MKIKLAKIILYSFVALLLLQVYQPSLNSDNGIISPVHFIKINDVPADVQSIFKQACYDCHSNNTNYKWFDRVQPARLWIEFHISKAKKDLNFSEWGNYSSRKQKNKLERIAKQIGSGEMPLASYTMFHNKAKLTDNEKERIIEWVTELKDN